MGDAMGDEEGRGRRRLQLVVGGSRLDVDGVLALSKYFENCALPWRILIGWEKGASTNRSVRAVQRGHALLMKVVRAVHNRRCRARRSPELLVTKTPSPTLPSVTNLFSTAEHSWVGQREREL